MPLVLGIASSHDASACVFRDGELVAPACTTPLAGKKTDGCVVCSSPTTPSGFFCKDVTELLGFRPLRHEGKVLGLAAFGDPDPLLASFRRAMWLSRDGLSLTSYFANSSSTLDCPKAYLAEVIKGHSQALVDNRIDCPCDRQLLGGLSARESID